MMTYGVTEITKIVDAAAKVAGSIEKILSLFKNGGLIEKLKLFGVVLELAPDMQVLATLDVAQLKNEMSDLDEVELRAIAKEFADKFALTDKNVEAFLEKVIATIEKVAESVITVIALFKK